MRAFSISLFFIALFSIVTPLILLFEFVQISDASQASLYEVTKSEQVYTEFVRETLATLTSDEHAGLRAIRDEIENAYEEKLFNNTAPDRTRVEFFEMGTYRKDVIFGMVSVTEDSDKSCRLYVYRADQSDLKGYSDLENIYCTPFLREAVR